MKKHKEVFCPVCRKPYRLVNTCIKCGKLICIECSLGGKCPDCARVEIESHVNYHHGCKNFEGVTL